MNMKLSTAARQPASPLEAIDELGAAQELIEAAYDGNGSAKGCAE